MRAYASWSAQRPCMATLRLASSRGCKGTMPLEPKTTGILLLSLGNHGAIRPEEGMYRMGVLVVVFGMQRRCRPKVDLHSNALARHRLHELL